jgi:hypothetical protein
MGLTLVTIALVQTWLYPIMNLWSALVCLGVLTLSYGVAKKNRKNSQPPALPR